MRQPSIVIHKGRKEEKYELYVEDYVISFLKEKRDMPNTEEILFYGCREKGGRAKPGIIGCKTGLGLVPNG